MINSIKNVIFQTPFHRGFEYALVLTIKAVALAGVVGVAMFYLAGKHLEKLLGSLQRKPRLR